MRIVIDARMVSLKLFGISRYVLNLINSLAAVDRENQYVVLVQDNSPLLELKADNFDLVCTPIKWLGFAEQIQLPLLLKKLKPDVFHATSFVLPVIKTCRTVATIHDLIHMVFPKQYGWQQKVYYDFILRRTLPKVEKIIADSRSTQKDLLHYFGIGDEKVSVVYPGVEARFKPINDPCLIRDFKIKNDLPERFVLYVGNRKKHKNLEGALASFAEFKKKMDADIYLVISGEKDQALSKLSKFLGLEKWLICFGDVPDDSLPLLYNAADLFIFPSFYEGFGLPPLEAMACGTPVICSDRGSLPEVSGEAALICKPEDIKGMAEAIFRVVSDKSLAEQLRRNGLEQARKFSWENCARETLKVYKKSTRFS